MDEPISLKDIDSARQRNLNEQAAAWLLKLEGEHTREAEDRFRRWLESSADHMQAFLEVTAIDRDLDGMDPERLIDLETLVEEVREERGSNVVALQETVTTLSAPAPRKRRRWKMPVAAAVAGLALLGGVALLARLDATPKYATATGEQRAVKLDDGSFVHLNTRSLVEVHFTQRSRDVRLLEGEALFIVQHDSARPFRVSTGSAMVQAVGTEFNVYRHDDATTVSVVEGRVRISAKEGTGVRDISSPDHLLLAAGEEANVGDDGRIVKLATAKATKAIAWRQRQLNFDHATLQEVTEQFNRYNRLQIRIADTAVRLRELEGVFNADEPQSLLDFLAQEKDLWFEREGNTIVIHAHPDAHVRSDTRY